MRDFNMPISKWGKSLSDVSRIGLYLNLLDSVLIKLTEKLTTWIIDLILVTDEDLVDNVLVGKTFDTNDHQEIACEVAFSAATVSTTAVKKIPDFRHVYLNDGYIALDGMSWDDFLNEIYPDVA